jgi:phage terminase large subunit-like protein
MTPTRAWELMRLLFSLPPEKRYEALAGLPQDAFRTIAEAWCWQAHGGQRRPGSDWRIWLSFAGRGFGKTRAGAEWVWARVREAREGTGTSSCPHSPLRIALVGATLGEVERVMVNGPAGLIATAGTGERPLWIRRDRCLRFPSGAEAYAYSAERPDSLRGPEHHFAWCDELAKWRYGEAVWDNLMMGLRCGERPQVMVTTTPRPVPLLRRILGLERVARTGGRSDCNLHLPAEALAANEAAYGGTRLGRQELGGELIEDVEGALWTRDMIEKSRAPRPAEGRLGRVVIGVDPPASAAGICGIIVCGIAEEPADGERIGYVLGDHSVSGLSPDGWGRAVVAAAEAWGADRVIVETNQGGDMVAGILHGIDSALPVRPVRARFGKCKRAEPVAALFEAGKAKFAGAFPQLEDQLCGMTSGGGYEGPGRSPDRADAMVWAMAELLLGRRGEPTIRQL